MSLEAKHFSRDNSSMGVFDRLTSCFSSKPSLTQLMSLMVNVAGGLSVGTGSCDLPAWS